MLKQKLLKPADGFVLSVDLRFTKKFDIQVIGRPIYLTDPAQQFGYTTPGGFTLPDLRYLVTEALTYRESDGAWDWFGWTGFYYDLVSQRVKLEQAQLMAQTLKLLLDREDRFARTHGSPLSIGQTMQRAVWTLEAAGVAYCHDQQLGNGMWWQTATMGAIPAFVDNLVLNKRQEAEQRRPSNG